MKRIVVLALALFAATVSAQQSPPQEPAGTQTGSKIALLFAGESQYFQVHDYAGFGGLAQALTDRSHTKKLLQTVNDRKVLLGPVMVQALQDSLGRTGFEVAYLPDQHPVLAADKKSDDYSRIETDARTILSVWFGATGFVTTAKMSSKYQPWLVVNVRLLDGKSKSTLLQKTYNCGYPVKRTDFEFIAADAKYQFGNFDDVMNRADLAIEALESCEKQIAERAALDLQPWKGVVSAGQSGTASPE